MSGQGGTVVTMISGASIDLVAPDWKEVRLSDVAYGLAAIRRWNGQAHRHISVSEHSRRVGKIAATPMLLPALLHDAHEAYFGDLITPSLNAIARLAGPLVALIVDKIKFQLDVAIARQVLATFGPSKHEHGEEVEALMLAGEMRLSSVKRADSRAAEIENAGLGRTDKPTALEKALPDDLEAITWIEEVKQACLERYGAANG